MGSVTMNDQEFNELEKRVRHILRNELGDLTFEEHEEDHNYIALQRKKDSLRIARQEALIRFILQWSVAGILGAIITLIIKGWDKVNG